MNWKRGGETIQWGQPLARLLFLALFFFGGLLLGQVLAGRVPPPAGEELTRYLTDYLQVEGDVSPAAALSAAVLYFRYPLAAFFLGFASIGVLLLPLVSGAFGFFLSFSVCCFTAAFGSDGVLLALTVFGLRCAITLPCYFLLAVPAWERSAALASLSFGRGRRAAPAAYGRSGWMGLAAVSAVLLAGVGAELLLSPWLLRQILEQVLFEV
ncbi:MAG: hypothetical protein HFG01_05750 [Oscillibacter sp.]|nr:hypothetical protein [Oscillibacter sp.]